MVFTVFVVCCCTEGIVFQIRSIDSINCSCVAKIAFAAAGDFFILEAIPSLCRCVPKFTFGAAEDVLLSFKESHHFIVVYLTGGGCSKIFLRFFFSYSKVVYGFSAAFPWFSMAFYGFSTVFYGFLRGSIFFYGFLEMFQCFLKLSKDFLIFS